MRFLRTPGTKRRALTERVVEAARSHLGYTALPNRSQPFGPDGLAWDGAFVDVCLAKGGFRHGKQPRHLNTTAALQYYVRERRAYRDPQVGDVVFFASGQSQSQPHVGIVVDAERWFTYGEFTTIEGETASGLPRARTMPDGVFEHTRYGTDVIVFGRPDLKTYESVTLRNMTDAPRVRPAHFKPGKPHRSVELVQQALGETVGLREARRGYWDAKTVSAYRAWQRLQGVTDDGVPTYDILNSLRGTVRGHWVVID